MGEVGAVLVADAMSLKLCTDPERDVDTFVCKRKKKFRKLVWAEKFHVEDKWIRSSRTADSLSSSINQAFNGIIS